jgi:hypothetical protein
LFVSDLQKISYVGPSLHLYQTIDAALQDLASGRIAVVVTGAASGAWRGEKARMEAQGRSAQARQGFPRDPRQTISSLSATDRT